MSTQATEDRLRDALGAAARTVPDTVPPPECDRAPKPAGPAWRWPVVAVATAAALALVVGLPTLLLDDNDGLRPASVLPSTIPAADQPPYYVSSEADGHAYVRDSTTGERIDTVPGKGYLFVSAAPDQRTFYVTRFRLRSDYEDESTIVRLKLRDDGRLADVEPVPGSTTINGYSGIALSPDGERIAFADADYGELGVLDLETGEQRIWPADDASLAAPSWTPDGRSLTFLQAAEDATGVGPYGGQLRVFDVFEDDDLSDSRAVTEVNVRLPGIGGIGHLTDSVVSADGKRVLAVFRTTADRDPAQARTKVLVEVALRTGEITIVDDAIVRKHVGEIGVDASRRHILVFTGNDLENPEGKWGVGVYDRESGRVNWLDKSAPADEVGW